MMTTSQSNMKRLNTWGSVLLLLWVLMMLTCSHSGWFIPFSVRIAFLWISLLAVAIPLLWFMVTLMRQGLRGMARPGLHLLLNVAVYLYLFVLNGFSLFSVTYD